MNKKIFTILLVSLITFQIFISVNKAIAVEYTLLEPLPSLDGGGQLIATTTTQKYLGYMFNLFIAVCAVAAVFMIVLGGFEYMTSDAVNKKEDGLKKIKGAIYGLLLALCSFLIVKTIDPRFVDIPYTLVPPIGISAQNDYFSTLASAMDKNKNISEEAKRRVAEYTNDLKRLEEEKQALNTRYAEAEKNNNTAEMNKIKEDFAALADEEKEKKILTSIEAAKASIRSGLATTYGQLHTMDYSTANSVVENLISRSGDLAYKIADDIDKSGLRNEAVDKAVLDEMFAVEAEARAALIEAMVQRGNISEEDRKKLGYNYMTAGKSAENIKDESLRIEVEKKISGAYSKLLTAK